jgi:SAM-dependent methyltransferase
MKDGRTAAQIREHYEVERELANRLRNAPKETRASLYTAVYGELFRRVPHHPMLTRNASPEERRANLEWQLKLLSGLLNKDVTYLEVGAGDCAIALEVARLVKKVYAVDVHDTMAGCSSIPENFQLILSDGSSIQVPKGSIDVVYSNQLTEHLHPDDVVGQLQNIFEALSPGGVYLCVTPNRLSGPHDISGSFDFMSTGLHLHEYTVTELSALFKQIGFSNLLLYVGGGGWYWQTPVFPAILCERFLEILPTRIRRAIARSKLGRGLIGIRLVGTRAPN